MLPFLRSSAFRSAAEPPSPNSRSKTTRGFASVGSGVVFDDHASVFMYTQLNPLSQLPTT
jgi:hypothetical protein